VGLAIGTLLAGLDEQQRAAATLGPGPAQVIAPAGSGKTATLVARIGVLITSGVPATRILVVTFNRDAAAELTARIETRLGVVPGPGGPEVRTLHALARQIVLDTGVHARLVADRLPLIRHARRQVAATLAPEVVLPSADELDAAVSLAILEERRHPAPIHAVVEGYRALLTLRGLIDFDGLLAVALTRLRTDEAVRTRWQARYEHVLVDEFQDVDAAQMDLVGLLAEPERNLFVVGDDDQTIYAWRLADVRRILEFPVRYPDARRVILETNYRCPARVVLAAHRLIATNEERVPKPLRAAPTRSGAGTGPPLWTWPLRGATGEDALAVALPALAQEHGRVAVLARTKSELAPISLALLRAGIPHATTIPTPLHAEVVSTLLEDLRTAEPGERPLAVLLRARAARRWRRHDQADALGEDDHAALDAATGWAVGHRHPDSYLAAFAEARSRLDALRRPDAPIELATVHGAKGREWPAVMVLGLEIDRFPNRRALVDAADPVRALEEERRLAYVAVTRCREVLILAFDPERPSPFVTELMGDRAPPAAAYSPTSGATASR
jgi:DNA helicase-2/ATP-dependent DNA helicase PcrA